ncbi:hypothetical protein BC826DRAFT_1187366 [Russula brevipes]|nr:hypothetical protein BC826DRAFT_1187366 [Russula brevipes]
MWIVSHSLNRRCCAYCDEMACFGSVHDPELECVPVSERTSGRSTPSSTMLVGTKPILPDKAAAESSADPALSVSTEQQERPLLGLHDTYIQGVCPHSDKCKYTLYQVHAMPDLAAMWLSRPCLPAYTPPGRQAYRSTPQPAILCPRPQSDPGHVLAYPAAAAPPPAPIPPAFIIPHEEAYAHAKLHHRPTVPSAETFSPAPTRPAVRLRHPSEDAAPAPPCEPGPGVREGHARRVSIAVQRLDAEFAGAALQARVRGAAKGHGRGKSLNFKYAEAVINYSA